MQYCESKPRKTLAAFIDFYYLPMIVGLVLALTISLTRTNFTTVVWAVTILLVDIVVVVVYYTILHNHVPFLTLGEILAGRIRDGETKKWINPYCANRTGLYIFVFITLILYGNSFDSFFEGNVPSVGTAIGKGVGIVLTTIGLARVARGKINSIFLPMAILALGAVLAMGVKPSQPLGRATAITFVAIGIIGFIAWLIYRKRSKGVGLGDDSKGNDDSASAQHNNSLKPTP